MSFSNAVHNTYLNATAVVSTLGLSIMQLFQWLEGVLPFVSLLLGTCTVAVLLYVHILTAKKTRLEIERLRQQVVEPPK